MSICNDTSVGIWHVDVAVNSIGMTHQESKKQCMKTTYNHLTKERGKGMNEPTHIGEEQAEDIHVPGVWKYWCPGFFGCDEDRDSINPIFWR